MQQAINQIVQLLTQIFTAIGAFLRLVWDWSFGQVLGMFQLNFASLPIWKQVLFVIVVGAVLYFLYQIANALLEAVIKVFSAGLGLVSAIIAQLKPVLIAGVIAFGGAWVIRYVSIPFLP